MSKKSILFFSLISLSIITEILSSITENVIIPKYGKKKIYDYQNAFLDVSGFDSGEKIYISITTSSYSHSYNTRLGYAFYINTNGLSFSTTNTIYESSSTSTNAEETYNYKIKKGSSNFNYLYLSSSLHYPITIENTEDDASTTVIIIVVVVSVVVIVATIIIIICCCRRCRARRYATVPYPSTVGYGVSAFGMQPVIPVAQPVVQPVGVAQPYYNPSPQYNQVSPAPIGSDVRVNQVSNYEKPV